MRFVLVHGWGFHAGIFADLVGHLDGAETTLIDLGFVSGGPKAASDWPSDAIAIGHSSGLLWLLEQGGGRFRGLVSIQGFDCFCCHIAPQRIAALKRGLEREPGATLQAFWRSCGASGFALPEALNVARLDQGLDWLMHWDARKAKAGACLPRPCPCRPRRRHRAGFDERGDLGGHRHHLVTGRGPCPAPEAPTLVRASCPRIRQCSPVVAPKSPQASALAPKATSVMPGFSARSPTGLARLLPERKQPNVLELGVRHRPVQPPSARALPGRRFVLTDAAPAMIAECRRNLAAADQARISFEVMDAGEAGGHADLDLIVSSMTLHWLADPVASLERLRRLLAPSGILLYATLGPDSFAEWRARARARGPAKRACRDLAASGDRRGGARGARCRHALLPPPHEGGRRTDAKRGLYAAVSRRAAPRHPRHRCRAWRPHHLAYRLWRCSARPEASHRGPRRCRHRRGPTPRR